MCDPLEFINPTSYNEIDEIIVECEPDEIIRTIEGDNKNKCGEIYAACRGTFILICGFCNDRHATMLDFGEHLSIKHEDKMSMMDNYYKLKYEETNVLLIDANSHPDLRMENIKSMTTSPSSPARLDTDDVCDEYKDKNSAMDDQPLKFTCEICGQTYKQKGRLRNHQIRCCKGNTLKLTGEVKILCKLCNKYFKSTHQLKRHNQRSHKDCEMKDTFSEVQSTSRGNEVADATYDKLEEEIKHLAVLHDEKSAQPSTNHATEDSNDSKTGPFDSEVNADIDDDNLTKNKSRKTTRQFACKMCGRIFNSKQSYSIHVRQQHNTTSTKGESPQLKSHRCKYCNQEFESTLMCNEHEATHIGEKRFICWYCPHTFRTNYGRKRHMRVHTGERPFKCSECPKAFPHMVQLDYHIRKHKNIREFSCQTCGKAFYRKFELTLHERRHTGFRPLVCEDCGKTFNVMSELNEHRKRHSDKKDWKCEVCGKCFYSKWTLKDHMAGHSGETPFACDVCGRKFSRAKALKKHKKLHSDVKAYVCNICGKAYAQDSGLYAHKKTHGMMKTHVEINAGFE